MIATLYRSCTGTILFHWENIAGYYFTTITYVDDAMFFWVYSFATFTHDYFSLLRNVVRCRPSNSEAAT